jgi:2,3-bisphosphoglycerate-independent phosphoglycerate mutase
MQKVILLILDGWGVAPPSEGNAPSQANIPNLKNIENYYPATTLHASGINVGLPWWEEGNSEVGHLTLGCGQVIYQYLPRIINAIQNDSFFQNPAFLGARDHIKKQHSRLHLIGLVSSGAVHSYIDHLYALLDFCKKEGIEDVYLHLFTDGRDAPQKEAVTLIKNLSERLSLQKTGKIATISGRSFAMDRDRNWDRIKKTYECLTEGKGEIAQDPVLYLQNSYQREITDEYIEPAVVDSEGLIQKNDAIIFFNFREDRARELTLAFVKDNFNEFLRKKIGNLYFATMTRYLDDADIKVAFEPPKIKNPLGKVISDAGFSQFRIAETEKYAHVTYFFNGLKEEPFPGEERVIIPSSGGPHYDRNPEMQAPNIKERVLKEIEKEKYHFILINLANPDMVGHTGNIKAAIRAAEIVDACTGEIVGAAEGKYTTLILADHGNFEEMISRSGEVIGEHSLNPVPFYLVDPKFKSSIPQGKSLETLPKAGGFLFDIAPTILECLELPKPAEMTGFSLIPSLTQ